MKIIEAWARGVPVVATPEAVKGLDVLDQGEAILAKNAAEFASAIRRLREDPGLRERLVETGRRNLVRQFDPARISSELEEAYATAISSFTAQGSDGSKSPS